MLFFPPPDVERYSDKYQMSGPVDNAIEWSPGVSGNVFLLHILMSQKGRRAGLLLQKQRILWHLEKNIELFLVQHHPSCIRTLLSQMH